MPVTVFPTPIGPFTMITLISITHLDKDNSEIID